MIKFIIIFYLCTPDRSNEKARSASPDERHQVVGIQYLIFWWWTGLLLEVRSPWLCWLWWWRSMWFQDTGQRTGNGFHFLAWKLFHFGWINLFLGQRNWLLCRWSAKEKEHDGDSRGDRCGSRLYPTCLLTWGGGRDRLVGRNPSKARCFRPRVQWRCGRTQPKLSSCLLLSSGRDLKPVG